MPVVDPFVPLREWRSSLYRGNEVVIEQFLARIDGTLPAGWVRDSVYEQTRTGRTVSAATCSTSRARHRYGCGSNG